MKHNHICNALRILIFCIFISSCSIGVYDPGREDYSQSDSYVEHNDKAQKNKYNKSKHQPQNAKNKTNSNSKNVDKNPRIINSNQKKITSTNENQVVKQIIENAKKHIGCPYKWGGTTPKGFDCSGYVQYVFLSCGIQIPRTPLEMSNMGTKISLEEVQAGDLVYFKGKDLNSSKIGHVAIVVKKTGKSFEMIHSTSGRGVIINNIDDYDYWKKRFLFATRFKLDALLTK